ncbi:hypothetical protein MtrunA17_Chr1g0154221 [Medicago truncatula]|uniref:Uncharacterized protein n=1 Tax=Medicago truncatula TaxID=3880 RepID=A0A396JM62_MEDTR|nr:hypothetical protein MtrunA17_Chr1g0154221 [Medicago truncatula]
MLLIFSSYHCEFVIVYITFMVCRDSDATKHAQPGVSLLLI